MADNSVTTSFLWTLVLLVTALFLALVVCAQIISTYTAAYLAAPREITTFIDTVDDSIQENESYDRDVARVQRLDDKLKLGRLLREIQKCSDDLREDLNRLVESEESNTIKTSARFLWAAHRKQLEERVRRLDLLRMRFLVVYMGIVAHSAGEREKMAEKEKEKIADRDRIAVRNVPKDIEKIDPPQGIPRPPPLPRSLTEAIKKKPPMRLKTSITGHAPKTPPPTRTGWLGVMQELQRSPILRQRHTSIEETINTPPPLSLDNNPICSSPVQKSPTSMTEEEFLRALED